MSSGTGRAPGMPHPAKDVLGEHGDLVQSRCGSPSSAPDSTRGGDAAHFRHRIVADGATPGTRDDGRLARRVRLAPDRKNEPLMSRPCDTAASQTRTADAAFVLRMSAAPDPRFSQPSCDTLGMTHRNVFGPGQRATGQAGRSPSRRP